MDHFRDGLATIYALVASAFLIGYRLDTPPEPSLAARTFACVADATGVEVCTCEGALACFDLGKSGRCASPFALDGKPGRGQCRTQGKDESTLSLN